MLKLRWLLFGASLLAMQAAHAHSDDPHEVRVLLEGVEPPVAGLRVQVYDDHLAPQLVVENLTGETVEILDDGRRAFLRISQTAVQADVNAHWWYRSVSPRGAPPAAPAQQPADPRWRAVRAQNAWGWFDPRLERPAAVPDGGAEWSVPARVGAQAVTIRGRFRHEPKPGGVFIARLTTGPELTPRVRVTLSPGRPPALLLENSGPEPVLVLGASDEAFLRITQDGVDANLASPTWQDLGRYRGLAGAAEAAIGGAPRWERVSLAPRYLWLEPRAGMSSPSLPDTARPPDNTRSKVKGWQVPVRIGDRPLAIQGVVEWVPLPSAQAKGRPAR